VAQWFVPIGIGMTALLFAVLGLCGWRIAHAWRSLPPSRWALSAAVLLGALLVAVGAYATLIEPRSLVVREITVESADWHGAPLRIAAISDTHVGGVHVDAARIDGVVREINGLRPDLVVLLGDYGAGHTPEASRAPAERQAILAGISMFGALDAPYGVVGVIGNHDTWFGRRSITRALQNAGVRVLWNRHVVIHRANGGVVVVAGIADAMTGHPDFTAALDGAPAGADTVILSHSPDPLPDMPQGPALMLAGHTHCGQVTIPLLGRPVLPTEHRQYACHLVHENGKVMFVTGGIGTSRLPVRFLNPPEVVLLTLRAAPTQHTSQ
jgi:hypothetical protein